MPPQNARAIRETGASRAKKKKKYTRCPARRDRKRGARSGTRNVNREEGSQNNVYRRTHHSPPYRAHRTDASPAPSAPRAPRACAQYARKHDPPFQPARRRCRCVCEADSDSVMCSSRCRMSACGARRECRGTLLFSCASNATAAPEVDIAHGARSMPSFRSTRSRARVFVRSSSGSQAVSKRRRRATELLPPAPPSRGGAPSSSAIPLPPAAVLPRRAASRNPSIF